ncbi:MAG: ABC transporter permease [Solirubrobacterales bacterium]|nr:ABC transporter permease [Solirubrobacterales bacterium]
MASVPVDSAPPREATTPPGESGVRRRPGLVDEIGELAIFSVRALRALPSSLRYFSEVMRLNAVITRRTSVLLFVMCGFFSISLSSFAFFLLRSLGASDFVGVLPGLMTTRLLAPQMFAWVFAGSVCCAIAAELGSAKIQSEIDAYEVEGVDPMALLVGTRILAVLLYVPVATAVSVAGVLGGAWFVIVVVLQGNSSQQLIDTYFSIVAARDLIYGAITIAVTALSLVLVACFYGLRTGGGPEAVGNTVARSLVVNLILLHILVPVCVLAFYGGALNLPIGD